jgi:hypothetical protein
MVAKALLAMLQGTKHLSPLSFAVYLVSLATPVSARFNDIAHVGKRGTWAN